MQSEKLKTILTRCKKTWLQMLREEKERKTEIENALLSNRSGQNERKKHMECIQQINRYEGALMAIAMLEEEIIKEK